MLRRTALAALIAVSLVPAAFANRQAPAPTDTAYPGTIKIAVDATDLTRRIFRVTEEMPVVAGPLSLHYPQWLPGSHSPSGPIDKLAGLVITANGKRIAWKRDPLDVYTINLVVPEGVTTLKLAYQFLSPLDRAQGRVVVTPEIIGLQWNAVLLYPAGHAADKILYSPSLKLPPGWKFGNALEIASQNGADTQFKDTDLETLMDSPLFAGKYYRQFDLDPGAKVPVRLNVVADAPHMLEATPENLAKHRKLVQQAAKLFGSHHYNHYDFLLALTERFSGIGLEHHQSSENSAGPEYLTDPKGASSSDLLAHEYTHSWNGKFRRGADLITANYNVPMQDSLLWVYEGQTQYWGNVLAARSGLRTTEQVRDGWALTAATYETRKGREWRDLADTTMQPIISQRSPQPWSSWQRGEDYYSEGLLVWLDADTLIREKTGGKKSLDDFAKAFFGVAKRPRVAARLHLRGRRGHAQRHRRARLGELPARAPGQQREGAARWFRTRRLQVGVHRQAQRRRRQPPRRRRRRLHVFPGPGREQGHEDHQRAVEQPGLRRRPGVINEHRRDQRQRREGRRPQARDHRQPEDRHADHLAGQRPRQHQALHH